MGPDANEAVINELSEAYFTSYNTPDGPKKLGFPDFMYGMSKVLINAWVKWFAQTEAVLGRGIQVYSLCPGYVKTDMAKGGTKTLAEGASTPLYLINLPYQLD